MEIPINFLFPTFLMSENVDKEGLFCSPLQLCVLKCSDGDDYGSCQISDEGVATSQVNVM